MKFFGLGALSSLVWLSAALLGSAGLVACGPGDQVQGDGDNGDGDNGGDGDDIDSPINVGDDDVDPGNMGDGDDTGDGDEPMEDCDATLELIVRDFKEEHPDMQNFNGGQDPVACGIVATELAIGADGSRQPVFQTGKGTEKRLLGTDGVISCVPWDYPDSPSVVTSAETFEQWYANVEGTNIMLEHTLQLAEDPETGNFFFDSGENGSEGFFPIDGRGFPEETNGHNFHFTTEAHVKFGYQAGQKFTFSGDDDLWIFVNGKLALDLGGMHNELTATLDFDAQASELGIVPNNTYNMDIYHAERYRSASNFRVETNISCFEVVDVPVVVR